MSTGDAQATPRTRRLRPALLLAVAVVSMALLVGAGALVRWDRGLPDGAVLRLDGTVHDEADLGEYLREQEALYGLEAPDLADDEQRRAAAQSLAIALVVDRAVARAGVQVPEAEVDRAVTQFLDRTYPEGRASFVEALADEGVSEEEVVEELRRQLLIERLFAEVTADVAVEPAQVRAAYEANPRDFRLPERRAISAIALADRAEAEQLSRGLEPATFATVARRRSLDSTTAPRGGDLGLLTSSQLQGPFAAAAFAAPEGRIFGPVRALGADYVYLGLVRSIRPARVQGFMEVRRELTDTLLAARALSAWQEFLTEQVRSASVEYAEAYRPADPGTLPRVELPGAESSLPVDGRDGAAE